MPDPTYTEAMLEALASAPSDTSIISTLSFYYEGLEINGAPSEIYIYLGWTGDRENSDGVPFKSFRLESTSLRNASAIVEFVAMAFDATLPDITNNVISKGKLIVDGVGREIADAMLAAVSLGKSIDVTYREYLEGMELDGPQSAPLRFNLQNVQITAERVTGDIGIGNVGNKKFPSVTYTAEDYPALTE